MAKAKKAQIKEDISEVEKVPAEVPDEMDCCKPESDSSGNKSAWIMALILGAMIILGLGYAYTAYLQKNMLIRACSDYSNSPDLKYPTVCVPMDADSNRGDYVDRKSAPMCRCKVDLGDGNSTIIDVRVAN